MDRDRRRWQPEPETAGDQAIGRGSGLVYDLVESLSRIIGDLERQLDSMLDLSERYEEEFVRERTETAATLEDLRDQLSEARSEHEKLDTLFSRARAERDEAVGELQRMEGQLERLMAQVGDLSERASALGSERQSLLGRLRGLEKQLRATEDERDALRAEVEESRQAMEEIREWVADAASSSGSRRGGDEPA
jgi:chromosome segregation ATPase